MIGPGNPEPFVARVAETADRVVRSKAVERGCVYIVNPDTIVTQDLTTGEVRYPIHDLLDAQT